jgi:amino acid adenylation domain-containing protein/non-ribosomal peptide synthase protein (TIGR01720 family)/FkbM family methyltransferase
MESFDLERGESLAVSLATLSSDEHLLALCLPGLCADAMTLGNLLREVVELYEGQEDGPLEEPVQYVDVAQYFRQILGSEAAEAGKEHWRRHSVRGPATALLPLEERRSKDDAFAPSAVERPLGAELIAQVAAMGQRCEVGMDVVFFTCWQVLLSRVTERPDLTVAVAFDGRGHEGLQGALGLFSRHLPVMVMAAEDAIFAQLLRQAHNSFLTARRWQEAFSWPLVVELSDEEQHQSFWSFCFEFCEPLFSFTTNSLKLFSLATEACWDRYKLKLVLLRRGDGFTARFEYDSSFLTSLQVERLGAAFVALLQGCLERPEAHISELPVVGQEEWRQLVFGCNDTWKERSPDERLHDPFEAQVERTPDAVAVVCGMRQITYRELDRRANQLAHRLRALGVGPESIVAIHLERSFAMVESILAVLKAGGAYLPLDPEYPRERLAFILKDAAASVLIIEGSRASELSTEAAGATILDVGQITGSIHGEDLPQGGATAANAAYLIYTSGSTGRPKGVIVEHQAIVNRLRWMQGEFPLTSADRVLQKTPYGFDASIWELFSPLWAGAQLILAEPGAHRDSARMVELIAIHGVTRLQLVPSLLGIFLDEPRLGECSSLEHLFCGGEALMGEWRERVFERLGCRLTNLYGPTEAAIDACFHPCRKGTGDGIEPIGRPLDNLQIYLLGSGMQCVATGMIGHLHIGGAGLARGYHGRPDLTAQRFLPDFLSGREGGRLYATGDLARRCEDGTLEYLGRTDQQVKVHGVRIELGEIEAVLSEHSGVQEAVVTAQRGEGGAVRLVAYAVPVRRERSFERPETLTLPNGLEVAYLNRNETQTIYREIFADATYLQHGIELADGACVFDVGANIGLFTLFVHQSCRNPRVFAFEPIPPTFARLRSNVELYGLDVELFECGLGSSPGEATFTFYRNWSGMSGIHADRAEDEAMTRALLSNQDSELGEHADDLLEGRFETELFSCRLTTFSEVISRYGIERVDLLKVDVEKSELAVLAGIVESDWKKIRQIVIEAHDREGQLAVLTSLLRDHGFEFAVEQDTWLAGTDLYNIYAVHREAGGLGPKRHAEASRRLQPVVRAPSVGELRDYLRAKLPETMVPAQIVLLEALPRMANGKVDRRALPSPAISAALDRPLVEPRTPAEVLLSTIWCRLLNRERISVEDNFFELGGDSILAIQLVSRARSAGLELNARQVFSHQTVAQLAEVAGWRTDVAAVGPAYVTGPIPLTPAQAWFFAQDFADLHHFNQAVLLTVRQRFDIGFLSSAVRSLALRHDALRLRFEREEKGWTQRLIEMEAVGSPLVAVNLSALAPGRCRAAIESVAEAIAGSLDLSRGPLLRAVCFDLGPLEPGRLLIVIHHLAVDGVSWRILLDDLETACEQLESGKALTLAPPTTSFAAWAQRLGEFARTMPLEPELSWWYGEYVRPAEHAHATTIPRRSDVKLSHVPFDLSAAETQALLGEVPAAYRTQINEVLLTALAGALADCGRAPVIELEGHGREELMDGVDLSRTVGWFTTLFPVRLELQPSWGPDESIRAVKEHLRAIPGRGIGYGLLRYLRGGEPAVRALRDLPPPQVSFNYLGQLDQTLSPSSRFAAAGESSGSAQSRRAHRSTPIDIGAYISGGRLRVTFKFDANVTPRFAVEPLADRFHERLRALVAHCLTRIEQRVGGYTPVDFPLAGLDQRELDRLLGAEWSIEDIYPLSPLQEGIFFHSLFAPGTGVYVGQLIARLQGELDVTAVEKACRFLVDRHPVLRTSFHHRELRRPLQVVHGRAEIELNLEDWRSLPGSEREQRLDALLDSDRRRGFELAQPPLLRWTLIRASAEESWFLWTHHHAIVDGWSYSAITGEFLTSYAALRAGGEPRIERRHPYRDYVAWLGQQDMRQAEEYWRRTLAGWSGPVALPESAGAETAKPGPASLETRLSTADSAALQEHARRYHLTLNTWVAGAWGLLLARHSGEEDVVFGTTVSGRPADLPGVESMVGLFINTLPVRLKISWEAPLLAWLERLQEQQTELRQYEHSPLVAVQGWSDVPRGRALFDNIFVFENYPRDAALRQGGAALGALATETFEQTHYPLTVVAGPGRRLPIHIAFDRTRFDKATVARLLDHLQAVLSGMAGDPLRRLADLPLLSEGERFQLLTEWNDTRRDWAPAPCLHDLFAQQVARDPHALAVVAVEGCLTYRELDHRSERLAHALSRLGVGPESLVGVCCERSPDALAAILGVLKVGGGYVPLDPESPRERLAAIIADAGLKVVLTQRSLTPLLAGLVSSIFEVDGDLPELPDGTLAGCRALADNVAYVIYTSGSTGVAKGVMITHRAVVNFVQGLGLSVDLGARDRLLLFAPLSFDASVLQIFCALTHGAALAVHRDPRQLASHEILSLCVDWGVSVLDLPAALWRQWVEEVAARQAPLPECLRFFLTGGESVPWGKLAKLASLTKHPVDFLSSYGPTEATVTAAVFTANSTGTAPLGGVNIPIGRPLPNVRAHVLDRWQQPLPAGVPGELHLGGVGLARGYLGRGELTAAAFLPDPLSGEPGARLYRTGDLAVQRPDGVLEFLGRVDRQVKVRGYRIEVGEIEAALLEHESVRHCVVAVREARPGDRQLAAYLVAEEGSRSSAPPAAELRDRLARRVPEYMIPSSFTYLERLPVLASGKVDFTALPKPMEADLGRPVILPTSAVERLLALLWREVLGVAEVGLHDNFFELGGHSLTASRLIGRVRDTFEVDIELRRLFETPSVAGLAAHLGSDPSRRMRIEKIAEIVLAVAELGDEEVERMLDRDPANASARELA